MTTILAGISFVSPWMLAGMGLAALPVAAHLLTRRTRRQIVFPTVRLLHQSLASTSRLYRLRRWLLLVLRCLAACLIAWAFARPVWTERDAADAGTSGASVVLLLDTSASMDQHSEGVSLSNSLQALAERVLDSLQAGTDAVGAVYASARPSAAFPELSHNLDILRKEIRQTKPTQERANFAQAMALAGGLLSNRPGQRRLVVISDLQRTNWSNVLSTPGQTGLPPGTVLTVLQAGSQENENVGLSMPQASPMQPILHQPAHLSARVTNYCPRERTVRVEATIDGRSAGTHEVSLKPWVGQEVAFETTFTSAGQHLVTFTVGPDSLSADNAAFLTVNAVRRVPVVVVSDDNPNQPGTSAYFLIRALAPRGDDGDDLEVRHLTSAELSYARIAQAEAVFVAYVGQLGAEALQALHLYANQGGGVAVFCGEGPVADNLQALKARARQGDLLPWAVGAPRDLSREGLVLRISEGAWDSQLLADFDKPSQLALGRVSFSRVWSAGPLQSTAIGLLRYADGSPALACQPVGAGKLLVCNFCPSLKCSDLGKYGVFVGLAQSLFRYLRPSQEQYGRATVGESFSYPIAVRPGGASRLAVVGPDERPCEADATGQSERALVHLHHPRLPGFYRVLQDDQPVSCLSVNLDERESDLRRADADILRAQLASDDLVLDVRPPQQEGGDMLKVHGRPLWPWMALGALAAIGLELALLAIWKQ